MNAAAKPLLTGFLTIYASGVLSMLAIFATTMWVHYQAMDYKYLSFALVRMLIIAIPVAAVGLVLIKRSWLAQLLFGAVLSPIAAALVIMVIKEA